MYTTMYYPDCTTVQTFLTAQITQLQDKDDYYWLKEYLTLGCLITFCIIQSNLYYEVTFGTKKKWSFKTVNLLKEVEFIWNFLWQDNKKATFKCRWLLNRGDCIGRFDCILISVQWKMNERPFLILFNYCISNMLIISQLTIRQQ